MKIARVGLLVLALVAGFACGPDRVPTAPAPDGPAAELVDDLVRATGLVQCSPLPYAVTRKVIGPRGGQIKVGPHVLTIPAGALAANVSITAEAPVGNVNSVRLSPHGLEFRAPAQLTLSYANCNVVGVLLPKRIAYTTELLEILSYIPSVDNLKAKKVTGSLDHFSRYAVAW